MSQPILVSACLLGLQTRYDGASKNHPGVQDWLSRHQRIPVPVCPEQLAGLPTPRSRTFFQAGAGHEVLEGSAQVVSEHGDERTAVFLRGARETLKIARLCGCRQALLKERSPSCGVHEVYCGEEKITGLGVAAALLQRSGIEVFSEEDLDAIQT
ncbi:DUF523 domain-containing protein [Geoalkalibacter halelectricus]|uniref:DUF523 domain-containing protein n=1 Tax=Geoalkalibacter halelectricus TaxID=2847045 RepID=A0ABY5ZH22_9BACT|nr:DUF523 domain-containing protein [Geoalkalibacter halelectricus]MDO3376589.1 DUF523 domain-containing protein [Geoalkalibacter halelectricus]UWZ78452.1 DUF523 domain-containing protein [Geoalkalibacter halelectricus]